MSAKMVTIEIKQKDVQLLLAALKHGEQKVIDKGNFYAAEKIFDLHSFLNKQIFEYVEA